MRDTRSPSRSFQGCVPPGTPELLRKSSTYEAVKQVCWTLSTRLPFNVCPQPRVCLVDRNLASRPPPSRKLFASSTTRRRSRRQSRSRRRASRRRRLTLGSRPSLSPTPQRAWHKSTSRQRSNPGGTGSGCSSQTVLRCFCRSPRRRSCRHQPSRLAGSKAGGSTRRIRSRAAYPPRSRSTICPEGLFRCGG